MARGRPPKPRSCPECGSIFTRTRKKRWRLCSVACREQFFLKRRKPKPAPVDRRLRIGQEVIKKNKRGKPTLFVVVSRRENGAPKYRAKAMLVAEAMLGRSLRGSEQVVFKDGDRLNVSTENIVVVETLKRVPVVCPDCGNVRILRRCDAAERVTYCCKMCWAVRFWFLGQQGIRSKAMKKSSWQTKLQTVMKMVRTARLDLYDRVALLAQVYEDEDFLAHASKSGKEAAHLLLPYVRDTCCNFTELYAIWKAFPRKQQWAGKDLSQLKSEAFASLGQASRNRKDRAESRPSRITLKEYRELQHENERLKIEVKFLREELEQARKELHRRGRKAG